ncbi:hypothetical protein NFI96_029210, partial [Prochilodus magdalenae]
DSFTNAYHYGLHPVPNTVLVSSRPSGRVLEGSSVTLNCHSEANPPVKNYTWYKRLGTEDVLIGYGQSYTISYISALRKTDSPKRVLVSSRSSGGILEGMSVALTCNSDANPPVESYTWFKRSGSGDVLIGSGQSYTIMNITSSDSNKYKCRASNQHGSADSEYIPLAVLYSPKRTSVSVTLRCSTDANPPVTDYTWFREGESEPVAHGETYSITSITKEDVAPFYCKAGNSIGHSFARLVPVTCTEECSYAAVGIGGFFGGLVVAVLFTILWSRIIDHSNDGSSCFSDHSSHVARLTLPTPTSTNSTQYGPRTVLVSSRPSGRVLEGSSVTLNCSSEANPPVKNYTWYKRSGTGDVPLGSGQSYTINNISHSDSNKYKCRASNQHGSAFSEYMPLDVVYSPKTVLVSSSPSGTILEGTSVTLNCSSEANPPVENYTWFNRSETEDVLIGSGQSYTIRNIGPADIYKYKCRASNSYGSAFSKYILLDVLYSPKWVLVFSRPFGRILEGISVTLTCNSDAKPPVESYTWFKRSGTEDVQTGYERSYRINSISPSDSNKYKCKASNRLGSAFSEYIPLDVLYGPKTVLVSSSPSSRIIEGTSVTLNCSSEANPPVNYTWFIRSGTENFPIGSGQSYTINNITSLDSNKYYCKASNQHGSAFSEYMPHNVVYSPKRTSVSVTLRCSTDANPPVTNYTWFREGKSEPVAHGETYSITSITKEDVAPFYCKAGNSIGHSFARPVPVTCTEECSNAAAGIGGFCGGLVVAVLFTILRSRWGKKQTINGNDDEAGGIGSEKQKRANENDYEKCGSDTKDDTYTGLNVINKSSDDVYDVLTYIQNSAARVLVGTKKSAHITSILLQLHWLPVTERIRYKILLLTFKALHGLPPTYLSALLHPYVPSRLSATVMMVNSVSLIILLMLPDSPKTVLVSSRPSGRVLEGSSVTLNCNSDANPPVENYTWFKRSGTEDVQTGSGQIYTINTITSSDSNKYKCRASNQHGSAFSEYIPLDVLCKYSFYRPKRVLVSSRPSGRVLEGTSVTLNCSSEANPPVENYTWFKRSGTGDVQTGYRQNYTINNISPSDSNKYKCRASNQHGSVLSKYIPLDVLYGPKTVLVSSSPSGRVLEGSSVNLNCRSKANPPVKNYTWFRRSGTEDVQTGSGQSYTINNITSSDSNRYKCRAFSQHGSAFSEYIGLDVLCKYFLLYVSMSLTFTQLISYRPKTVLVSSRPSGEILEGSSVTLNCSSEANPPVENYTWFERSGTEDVLIGYGQSYTIGNITPSDSNKYKCRASNQHGSVDSEYIPLDVVYSPKETSVSVTLRCNAYANPPVTDYTWFREGESEPVAHGETYNITSITKEDITPFYCKAGNRIGFSAARLVPVTITEESSNAAAGIGGFCGGLVVAVLFTILWLRFTQFQSEAAGFNQFQSEAAGFNQFQSEAAGFNQFQSEAAGFNQFQSEAAGFNQFQSEAAGFNQFQSEAAGFNQFQSEAAGFNQFQSEAAGFNQFQSEAAGFNQFQSEAAGFNQFQSEAAGFNQFQSEAAGFNQFQREAAGFNQFQREAAGFNQFQREAAGFNQFQSEAAGFKQFQSEVAGFNQFQSEAAGFNQFQSEAAGFNQFQSEAAGFNQFQSEAAGFNQFQNTKEDTYTGLNLMTQSPDDVYEVLTALLPREVVSGKENQPYAQRTDLGWCIVGHGNPCVDYDDSIGTSHHIVVRQVTAGVETSVNLKTEVHYVNQIKVKEITPADHASQGLTAEQLKTSSWFRGPKFFWERDLPDRNLMVGEMKEDDPELRKTFVCNTEAKEWFTIRMKGLRKPPQVLKDDSLVRSTQPTRIIGHCNDGSSCFSDHSSHVARTSSPAPITTDSTQYGPQRVIVSSSPYGGIIEGNSVILTCSSDANPPVESYTWFKRSGTGDVQMGSGQSYRIDNISPSDSNKYKCRASNRHGSAFSEYIPLDVLYSPKETSVSVTLRCNAYANPPVTDYTWFREGESEPVAHGETYSISSITKEDITPFYCQAGNRIGHSFARLVPVTYTEQGTYAAVGIGGFCGGLVVAVLVTILWSRWKKKQTTNGNDIEAGESRRKKQNTANENDYKNFGSDTKDDPYTGLNLMTKSPDDVYEVLTVPSSHSYISQKAYG